MRSLMTVLAVAALLLAGSFASPISAWDEPEKPSAAEIESLLRKMLAKDQGGPGGLAPFRSAELKDFELIVVEPLAPTRWDAQVELIFDFGPPPPGVLGFESVREGRYHLRLSQDGRRLELLRFNPVGQVYPLPVSQ